MQDKLHCCYQDRLLSQHNATRHSLLAVFSFLFYIGGSKGMYGVQVQQLHRMSCGPFSLNYGGEGDTAATSQTSGVRSRTRR